MLSIFKGKSAFLHFLVKLYLVLLAKTCSQISSLEKISKEGPKLIKLSLVVLNLQVLIHYSSEVSQLIFKYISTDKMEDWH